MTHTMLSQDLLEILRCPLTRAKLVLDGERLVSVDAETRRAYRIEDGFPVMLIEESVTLTPEEHTSVLARNAAEPSTPPTKEKAQK